MRLVLAAMLASTAHPARADDATASDAPGEVIVIEELRRLRPPTYDPATTIVIEREEIEQHATLLPDDLVRLAPSVAMFRRSSSLVADPTSQGANLRGVGPSGVARTVVLRDGIPLNDPFGGWVYWRAVPVHALQRIEIQPSGASSLFGNFGLGGAIALASRPIEAGELSASVAGGSLATLRAGARAADRLGPVGIELVGELVDSAGYAPIAPTDRGPVDGAAASSHRNAGLRAEHVVGRSTVRAFGRWFDEDLDAGTLHTTARVRALSYGATWAWARKTTRIETAVFGGTQRLEQTRARVAPDRATAVLASSQGTPSNNQGASASVAWTPHRVHVIQAGIDAARVSGAATDEIVPAAPGARAVVERTAGGEQRFLGAFVQDAAQWTPRFATTLALRADLWQNVEGHRRLVRANGEVEDERFAEHTASELSPRLGAIYRTSDELALRGSVYRAFRAPTLNELYRPFQVGTVMTSANAELASETLWGVEAGPQLVVGPLVARATGFYHGLTDPIFNATVQTGDGSIARMRQNLDAARVAGLELETAWRHRVWSTALAYTFMNAQVTAARDHAELVGKRLAQVPRHRASAMLAYDDPRIATLVAELRYTSRQFEDDLNALSMGAFAVLDLHARRRIAHGFSLFASGQNLLDRRYVVGRAGVDTLGAPRMFLAGVAYNRRDALR